jgi:hypothetical protein
MTNPERIQEMPPSSHLLAEGAGWPLPASTYNYEENGVNARIGITDIGSMSTRLEYDQDSRNLEIPHISVSEHARGKSHYDVAKSLFGAMKSMAISKKVDTVSITANNEAIVVLMVETFGEDNIVISTLEKPDAPTELIESDVALQSLREARMREFGDLDSTQMLMEGVRIIANLNKDPLGKSSLRTTLDKLQKSNEGRQLQVPELMQEKFSELMSALGFTKDGPDKTEVAQGVQRAEKIIYSGEAQAVLEQMPFKHRPYTEVDVFDVDLPQKFFVNPELITGAESFVSWSGRGAHFKSIVNKEGDAVNARSIDIIKDYASRETQLPYLEDGVTVHITDTGLEYYTMNSHRTAAALLRQEHLGFESVKIIDRRTSRIVITEQDVVESGDIEV